jgi:hypothetical protein
MDEIERRKNRVAQSILDNERLTADLDDDDAQALLDWGVSCAKLIASSTADLDNTEAQEMMHPRLRATRRLMRHVNRWIADARTMDKQSASELLSQIIEQAAIVYGEGFVPLGNDRRESFLRLHLEFAENPQQLILALRELLENPVETPPANGGEDDDQEKDKRYLAL